MSKQPITKKMNCEIQVYDVLHCGLYETTNSGQRSRKSGAKHVLPFAELIDDLKGFAYDQNLQLANTSTYSASGELLPTYCFDFQKRGNDYLLALWNEVPKSSSGIQSLDGAQTVQGQSVHTQKTAQNSIPGFMTYFWLLPKQNKIATVKIWEGKRPNSPLGTHQFNQYIKGFYSNKCSHLITYVDNGQTYTGFSEHPRPKTGPDSRVPNTSLKPFWATGLAKSKTKVNELKRDSSKITSVMRRIKLSEVDPNGEIQNTIFAILRLPKGDILTTKKYLFTAPVDGLSKSEIDTYINDYTNHHYHDDYNMGFKITGNGSPTWLAGCFQKEEGSVTIDIRPKDGLPDALSLLQSLKLNFRNI